MDADVVFNNLNELHPDMANPRVRVQVFAISRKFNYRNPNTLGPMEVILIDQHGDKMIAFVEMSLIALFENMLVEGHFLQIDGFSLVPYQDHCKLINTLWMIRFLHHTQLLPYLGFHLPNDGYHPVSYTDINNNVLHPRIAFDVVGRLVELWRMRVNHVYGHVLQSITFTLEDLEGNRIRGTIWSKLALQLHEYATNHVNDGVPLVCLLNNVFIKQWQGAPFVSNHPWGSRLFINAGIDSIVDYTQAFEGIHGGGILEGQNDGNNAAFIFID
ncbi:uncharacterized protein [Rutidosis leptorrhynchoides]|uniref:uncharacterized protein n=1 Tax=Rutidosis leptorrhynchoides TaxID=125765 RepID=UPI003A999B1B